MKLQKATVLGLYAILELADQPDQQLSRLEIAERFSASSHHLSKVMRELVKAGLVEAVRGVGGGYRFAGNAKRTTLMDVIRIFEPFLFDKADRREPGKDTDIGMTLNVVMDEINETINATLNSISIQTMLMTKNRMKQKAKFDEAVMAVEE